MLFFSFQFFQSFELRLRGDYVEVSVHKFGGVVVTTLEGKNLNEEFRATRCEILHYRWLQE
jgi:hypothetical protein